MTDSGTVGVKSASPVILIVEDMEDLRTTVSEYLHVAGFEVITAANARDALTALGSGAHIDLVFTDVNMPGVMDGADLARWIAEHRPDLPILLTTGESRPNLGRASPTWHFVAKPYSLDLLEQDVRDIISVRNTH